MSAPLRILLVDDEAPARQRLRYLLHDLRSACPSTVVGEATHGLQALELLCDIHADVALVDIRMPLMDGIQLAMQMRIQHPDIAIIFTTAFDQFAVKAFELTATDYLLKPINAERLHAALKKVSCKPIDIPMELLHTLAPSGRMYLRSTERGRVTLVPLTEIVYLRAEFKYVMARTLNEQYLIDESLANLEQEFAGRFIRVHRSCLVAKVAINGYEKQEAAPPNNDEWVLTIKGLAEKIPVSRRQWARVKEALSQA